MTAETNAERLEQIGQYRSNFLLLVAAGILNKKIITDFDWLFEQAERAQELDRKLKLSEGEKGIKTELNNAAVRIIEEKDRENARLREALENILTESVFEDIHRQLERIIEVASQALAGETNGQRKA